jgi:hypothetical protein
MGKMFQLPEFVEHSLPTDSNRRRSSVPSLFATKCTILVAGGRLGGSTVGWVG